MRVKFVEQGDMLAVFKNRFFQYLLRVGKFLEVNAVRRAVLFRDMQDARQRRIGEQQRDDAVMVFVLGRIVLEERRQMLRVGGIQKLRKVEVIVGRIKEL